MRTVSAGGLEIPVLGQGSWYIGDDTGKAQHEMRALRQGLELGMKLIDTAEMYGDGRSEQLIGRALQGIPRKEYLLESKVYPHNAGRKHIFSSCDASLKRLKTDYLDLYLLHWRGSIPLAETVDCMEELVKKGKIRRWGVSNFDVSDMEELWRVPNGKNCAVDQVLYHLGSRGIEFDLIPWLKEHGVAAMAYCPLAQAGRVMRGRKPLLNHPVLQDVSQTYKITVMQLMLAFVLRQENMTAIPRTGSARHAAENAASANICIAPEDWEKIDSVFAPPLRKVPLDME